MVVVGCQGWGEPGGRAGKGAVGREGAVERRVEHGAGQGDAPRPCVVSLEGVVVGHRGQPVDPIRLVLRARVGARLAAVEGEAVARSGAGGGDIRAPPAALVAGHLHARAVNDDVDPLALWGPHREAVRHLESSSRASTTTGKASSRSARAVGPGSTFAALSRSIQPPPAGTSMLVSSQSSPRPTSSRGTTTTSPSRSKATAWRAFPPVAAIGRTG